MKTFDNQYNFRISNQIKVLSALRKGPLSLNSLAEKLGVSFTAISKIVDELVINDVVTKTHKKGKTSVKGRTPVTIKINNSIGVTAAIDLSRKELTVAISDFESHIIVKKEIPQTTNFTEEVLYDLGDALKELLAKPEVNNRPLCGICISCPGMIYKGTGDIKVSSKIRTYNRINPLNYFFNTFGVPVNQYNDVKIGMVGERIYGCIPSDAKNYMFIHIGNGCGASFSFDGHLYQGKNGFSGELTTYHNDISKNWLNGFNDIAQKIKVKDPSIPVIVDGSFPNKALIAELYQKNDPVVNEVVNSAIKENAKQIIAYNDMLDLEYIIIEGSLNTLGDKWKKELLKDIDELDANEFSSKILFSSLSTPPSLLGAIYQANNIYFLNKLEKMKNERHQDANYDIEESFGENI